MADLHERLETAAARPGRAAPLAQVEQRLRARRRARIGGVVVASLVCVGAVGGGIAVATSDGGGGRVSTTRPASSASGVTVTLPEGWVEHPLALEPDRTELIAVSSPTLPARMTLSSCPIDETSLDAVGVVIAETWRPMDAAASIGPRPDRFETAASSVQYTCSIADEGSALESTNDVYVFEDQGRIFVAEVIVGASATGEERGRAFAVLDSMVIEPAPVPQPSIMTIPTTVPPSTVAPSPDEQSVRDVFLGWINTQPRDAAGQYIEDWESIKDAVMQAAATAPLPLDAYTGQVDAVTAISDTEADVVYSFLNGGAVAVGGLRGHAVKIDGVWKVSRETVCAAIEIGGVSCPPRTG